MLNARMTTKARSRAGKKTSGMNRGARPYNQRCAVRVTYSRSKVKGQWGAHGRYVARETATHEVDPKAVGFDNKRESIDISAKLDSWQKAGDEQMWKFIVSPEFGDRVDLKVLTRELMTRVGRDLGDSHDGKQDAWLSAPFPYIAAGDPKAPLAGKPSASGSRQGILYDHPRVELCRDHRVNVYAHSIPKAKSRSRGVCSHGLVRSIDGDGRGAGHRSQWSDRSRRFGPGTGGWFSGSNRGDRQSRAVPHHRAR